MEIAVALCACHVRLCDSFRLHCELSLVSPLRANIFCGLILKGLKGSKQDINSGTGRHHCCVPTPVGPTIVPGDDRVPVAVGGDVTLLCGRDPRGNPAPVAEWRDNNGTVVPDGGRYSIVSDSSEVSLSIQGVTANDAGDWQCSLTVEVGNRMIGHTVVRRIILFVVGENCFF